MAFGEDEVAADASWPGVCGASLVSPLVTAVPAHSTCDLAALAQGSTPASAFVKTRLIFFYGTIRGVSWTWWCFCASVMCKLVLQPRCCISSTHRKYPCQIFVLKSVLLP